VDRSFQRDLQHIGLPTACAEVYAGITGAPPDAREPQAMQAVLEQVAAALAYVIRIYRTEPASGVPSPIGGFDALRGSFVRGAHAFRTPDGEEVRGLTVQRRDLQRAIEILRSAKIRFRVS
jgi:hypothetical protein